MGGGRVLEQLPRKDVESPFLQIFETHLDKFLCHLLQMTLPGQVIGLGDLQR